MPRPQAASSPLTIVGLGEALFDCFEDRVILGGAPLNLAVHANQLLAELGGRGIPVSRVGEDELGERMRSELEGRCVNAEYLQSDSEHGTGAVQVTVDAGGNPTYEITEGVAWDFLEFNEQVADLAAQASAVCFGTLAQRSEVSRTAIRQFLAAADKALIVCDINLRQHYFDAEILRASFEAADVLKINEEEIDVACELLQLGTSGAEVNEKTAALRREFDIETLALTQGAKGTTLYTPAGRCAGEPASYPRANGADSVGAGDSCCAALVTGLLLGWSPERTTALANEVGAYVASQSGATPELPPEILAKVAE